MPIKDWFFYKDPLVPKPGKVYKDPWARFEAWRYQPEFTVRRNLMRMIPGLTWGIGAFLVAITVEKVFFSDDSKSSGHH